MTGNVPNSEPTPKRSVPNSEPSPRSSLPNSQPTPTGKSKPESIKPDQVITLERNARRYTGQKLGVKDVDGRIDVIPDSLLKLAILEPSREGGFPRILDRGPWSGIEIVEL